MAASPQMEMVPVGLNSNKPKLGEADDTKVLEDMGYKQELLRGFGGLNSFTFCFTAVNIVSSLCGSYGTGLYTGGPVVMIWGWIVGSFFTIIIGSSMAEICSAYPSAGSVYHWAGQLGTKGSNRAAAYITGYFNLFGNAAGDAYFASVFGQMVMAAATVQSSVDSLSTGSGSGSSTNSTSGSGSGSSGGIDYSVVGPQVGVAIAAAFVFALINTLRMDRQGKLNNFSGLIQVSTAIVIIVSMFSVGSTRATSKFVWTTWYNGTGLDDSVHNQAYVVVIGLLMTLFSFSGYEAAGHVAEETRMARKYAPIGIIATCVIGAVVGLLFLLGLLYATPDIDYLLNGGGAITGTAIVDLTIFNAGTTGGIGLTSVMAVNVFFAGISSMTVTARIAFAMVRDNALPGSKYIYNVDPDSRQPLGTVVLVFVFDVVLLLLQLVSSTAFVAITSITVIGYQISYAIPILQRVTTARHRFKPAYINYGRWAEPMAWVSGIWLLWTSIVMLLPSSYPITSDTFNYTFVVVLAVLLVALFNWFVFGANKHFKGPKVAGESRAEEGLPQKGSSPVGVNDASLSAVTPSTGTTPFVKPESS